MMPYSPAVTIRTERKRTKQRWLVPFWLLCFLLVPLFVLLVPIVLIVCLAGRMNPFPLISALWKVFMALKGTIVEVDDLYYSVCVHIC